MALKSSNKVDTNRYQLEVEIDGASFEKAVDQAYRKQNKKIMIPGFRKGKAPRAFVEKYYGAEVFYEDAINALYPDALEEAVNEAKLDMIEDKIDFDLVSAGKDGLVFKATITTKPEVQIEGYKGIEAKKAKVAVTDEAVDAEIAKVQDRNSRMVTVEDRAAQNDDIAVIDFEGFVDGVAFEGGKAENFSLTLGSGQFIPGFEEQIVGKKTDEEFDVNVTFPEDYHAEELKGKAAVFHCKLHEIKEKELPEADDEFAKDASEFDTLDELKADMKKKLEDRREKEAEEAFETQLIDQLVEKLQGEIPEAMFENRINQDVREFDYRLQSQGLNLDLYLQYTGMDMDGFRAGFREQAEKKVKLRLALEKIAELEDFPVSDEELDEEYKNIAEQYKMDVEKIKGLIREKDLKKDLAVGKAMELVKDTAAGEGKKSKK